MATANKNLSDYDKTTIPNASSFRFGIVVSEWNDTITEALYLGAYDTLVNCGVNKEHIMRWNVPGSFELIHGCKKMQQQNVDAVIAIGSVIQGDPLAANGMLFFKGWLSLLMGIRERVAGDGKWAGIWHIVGVDGQKFSWTYDRLVQSLSKMFLMNNEKGLN